MLKKAKVVRQEAKVGFRVAKCSSDDGTAPRDRTGTRTELESHTLFVLHF